MYGGVCVLLEINIKHDVRQGFLLEVVCDREIRHMGSSVFGSPVFLVEALEEVFFDYRE